MSLSVVQPHLGVLRPAAIHIHIRHEYDHDHDHGGVPAATAAYVSSVSSLPSNYSCSGEETTAHLRCPGHLYSANSSRSTRRPPRYHQLRIGIINTSHITMSVISSKNCFCNATNILVVLESQPHISERKEVIYQVDHGHK